MGGRTRIDTSNRPRHNIRLASLSKPKISVPNPGKRLSVNRDIDLNGESSFGIYIQYHHGHDLSPYSKETTLVFHVSIWLNSRGVTKSSTVIKLLLWSCGVQFFLPAAKTASLPIGQLEPRGIAGLFNVDRFDKSPLRLLVYFLKQYCT